MSQRLCLLTARPLTTPATSFPSLLGGSAWGAWCGVCLKFFRVRTGRHSSVCAQRRVDSVSGIVPLSPFSNFATEDHSYRAVDDFGGGTKMTGVPSIISPLPLRLLQKPLCRMSPLLYVKRRGQTQSPKSETETPRRGERTPATNYSTRTICFHRQRRSIRFCQSRIFFLASR